MVVEVNVRQSATAIQSKMKFIVLAALFACAMGKLPIVSSVSINDFIKKNNFHMPNMTYIGWPL